MNGPTEFRRPALIRGHGHARICFVTTAKNRNAADLGGRIFRPPIAILDGDDNFEDGTYELVLGAQRFELTKDRGEYREISESVPVDDDSTYRAANGL